MPTRNHRFAPGEYYHVFNRGNSKQSIFINSTDYERFKILLYISNTNDHFNIRDLIYGSKDIYTIERSDILVRIGAYCLMPNHFHLVVSPLIDGGLSKFMLKLATGYSMYFNTKYERTGRLFENSFKSKHIDSDEYLKYLFSYVHLNPVCTKLDVSSTHKFLSQELLNTACEYPHSSLRGYISPRVTLGEIDTSVYSMYFRMSESEPEFNSIRRELLEWLNYGDYDETLSP